MNQQERAAKIEEAAYNVLQNKGFKGASMLAIAKRANASNETLYKWYGDKIGLFSAMIENNARIVADELSKTRHSGKTGLPALRDVGRSLLAMVTSDKAVALNRAAAGDVSGKLGHALAQQGRDRVLPILSELLQEAYGPDQDIADHLECYISLLLGDLQIRRVNGALAPLSDAYVDARADRAIEHLQLVYPVPSNAE
ncbi:TetR/AcrR family transcriptional regulator [Rhodobacteraceae bacterium NNCM2]|nr:TetR/AcrR family transcriptional regulator [Coraliihabitans acroporae]